MKILFVQTNVYSDNSSGVPRLTYNLGKYFTQVGLDVAYFSFKTTGHINVEHGELYHAVGDHGVNNKNNLIALTDCISNFQPNIVINQMAQESKLRRFLNRERENHNFKLIGCIHNSLFAFKSNVKAIMKRELPKPFNYIMATDAMSKIPMFYHQNKQKKELTEILKFHDILLLNTPANLKELKYFVNAKELEDGKIHFMMNPVLKIQKKLPKKEKVILHLGRLNNTQKRSDLLLDFWGKTYRDLPDWQFKVVGNGPYYETLVSDLQKRKLPRIDLLGFQKAEPYYKEAAIFMMPSANEGLPHTIIDSQSFGCPTLAFNSYAALEYIVDDGVNALLAKPFNTTEMAKLCVDLVKNDLALANMQNEALKNAERYSIQKIGRQWLALFDELSS